jgi:hypothetical protein
VTVLRNMAKEISEKQGLLTEDYWELVRSA